MLVETILSGRNIVKKTPERKNKSLSLVQPSGLFLFKFYIQNLPNLSKKTSKFDRIYTRKRKRKKRLI
jgi:hypothetical protein